MRTIAIINQKGGSGKTTTAINLAASLARIGHRSLLVDLDPQSHCALGLAIPESQIDLQIGDALLAPPNRSMDLTRLIWSVSRRLDLIPSATKLAAIEAARGGLADVEDRESRLASFLTRLADQYEYCLVDCPPSIGLLTYNALRASDEVLIPVETGFFALQGAAKQANAIKSLCRRFGIKIPFRVVATLHDPHSRVAGDVLTQLRERFSKHITQAIIRTDAHLREAACLGVSIHEHDPSSQGARDYAALALEIAGAPGEHMEHAVSEEFLPHTPAIGEPRRLGPFPAGEVLPAAAVAERPPATRVAAPRSLAQPVTRAAELAARARLLASRSAELSRRLESDPEVARVLAELDAPETTALPATVGQAAPRGRIYGVHQTRSGVVFVQPAAPEATVCVAGEHNNWSPASTPMRYNPSAGVHELCLPLAPGRYRYRLVINGRWLADPYNPVTEPNPFGDRDSILEVAPAHPHHPHSPLA